MGKIAERIRQRYADREGAALATKDDVNKLRRELDNNLRRAMSGEQGTGRRVATRAAKMAKRGLGNIEKSLNSPSDNRRPRISQMPARRSDIGIVNVRINSSLEYLKPPELRGQNISGRKGSKF
jgi:hypothetical protein